MHPRSVILAKGSNQARWREDICFVERAHVEGDELYLTVSYTGGCEAHDFNLIASDRFIEDSTEIQTELVLKHDAHGDACKAIVRTRLGFRLDPLRGEYASTHGMIVGTVVLRLRDFRIPYSFRPEAGRD
jgi:NigD-like C-terminal beta sandwich domain